MAFYLTLKQSGGIESDVLILLKRRSFCLLLTRSDQPLPAPHNEFGSQAKS